MWEERYQRSRLEDGRLLRVRRGNDGAGWAGPGKSVNGQEKSEGLPRYKFPDACGGRRKAKGHAGYERETGEESVQKRAQVYSRHLIVANSKRFPMRVCAGEG